MKWQSLIENSRSAVEFMTAEITHICRDMDKRAPGSRGEREAGNYMAQVLEKDCGCENVRIETFREHPDAFYGYFYFSAALDTLCAVTFFLRPVLSIIFGLAALLLFLFQFVLYKQVIDPLFKEKESLNITAIRPPSRQTLTPY